MHGPVRPVWLQGSSVTTAVAPRASSPAAARASASACGLPAPRWKPSPTSAPEGSSRTQPTRGLGPAGTPGVAASARARSIAECSAAVKLIGASGACSRTQGAQASRRGRTGPATNACVLLLIRTLTVGPGVPPGQPATAPWSGAAVGSRTVTAGADFHRPQSTRALSGQCLLARPRVPQRPSRSAVRSPTCAHGPGTCPARGVLIALLERSINGGFDRTLQQPEPRGACGDRARRGRIGAGLRECRC